MANVISAVAVAQWQGFCNPKVTVTQVRSWPYLVTVEFETASISPEYFDEMQEDLLDEVEEALTERRRWADARCSAKACLESGFSMFASTTEDNCDFGLMFDPHVVTPAMLRQKWPFLMKQLKRQVPLQKSYLVGGAG
ncbi:hypothetical protein [Schauerella aestuarii]|uniref:hypothetical protein n=1 Tax=Schauerella aestuarii TaxID=2511204 RepID=UPI00136D0ADD|nr:hypothetical protein [Achromobacter aestuarii]MYZ41428.1 hypothetical protein [Achromobacter aestuarii]